MWHKLYSSRSRRGEPEKATKDYQQAVTLTAALGDYGSTELKAAFKEAPVALKKKLTPGLLAFSREFKDSLPEVVEALQVLRRQHLHYTLRRLERCPSRLHTTGLGASRSA
jgi:hypothetical protein